MSNPELLSIGAFAEAAMLSHKALRLYDERGLLVPVEVDPFTGYRYYAAEQAKTGRLISMLRAADMSLKRIQDVVEIHRRNPVAAGNMVDQHLHSVRDHAASTGTLLSQVRAHLTGETMENVSAEIKPEQPVLSVLLRSTVEGLDDGMKECLDRLHAVAAGGSARVTAEPFGIFHGTITPDTDGPLEICLPVGELLTTGAESDDGVRSYRLPGGRFAVVTVEGADTAFPAILAAYDRACSWIEDTGAVRVGPPREIWHVLPWSQESCRMSVAWPYA